jgi:hypothetical protein
MSRVRTTKYVDERCTVAVHAPFRTACRSGCGFRTGSGAQPEGMSVTFNGKWPQRIVSVGPFEMKPMRGAASQAQRVVSPQPRRVTPLARSGIRVERLEGNPIIRPAMLPGNDGNNINGPSLIRVPPWITDRLGNYYLYFAHHEGKYIRLAYADALAGPWKVHAPGVLAIESTPCDDIGNPEVASYKHVASPDVHVDDDACEIRMYFHGPVHVSGPKDALLSYRQMSMVATSRDAVHFDVRTERLGNAYFRAFRWNGAWYALSMPGVVYRSDDGLSGFVAGPTLFPPDMRHSAINVDGAALQVYYSNAGDNPERILLSMVDLSRSWTAWRATVPRVVLEPEMDWEGAALPAKPSIRGIAPGAVRELRDPAIFVEAGRTYLLYSVAGESGIAIAELHLR